MNPGEACGNSNVSTPHEMGVEWENTERWWDYVIPQGKGTRSRIARQSSRFVLATITLAISYQGTRSILGTDGPSGPCWRS